MSIAAIKKRLYESGIVSILRGGFSPEEMVAAAAALLAGGITVVEVTMNSEYVVDGIAALRDQLGDKVLIGAGTVRTAQDVERAVDAGAAFLVAPCLDLPSVETARRHDILLLPGIFTASEAQAAFVAGCETVKLFPADALGPSYLKALRAPLDHIDFLPTGGITPGTLPDFHAAGAVAFGAGSYLVKNEAVTSESLEKLTARARLLQTALEQARA